MDFSKRYDKLNTAQKQAVDTIDGPVMVIAGPGTGKTELLSIRAANILRQTDTMPENILCLTFTDSGANAIRKRLIEIIGKDAYKIAVHTFHSFGTEIINQNSEYFYQGAQFKTADNLSSYEILHDIFEKLDHNSPISSKMNGEFTYLSDGQKIISEFKKSGLVGDELLKILDSNDAVIEKTEKLLLPIFDEKIDKKTGEKLEKFVKDIKNSGEEISIPNIKCLSEIIAESLIEAIEQSTESNHSTKPITAWRNRWFKKDKNNRFFMACKEQQKKLRSLIFVYEQYMANMQNASLYDFDDMILRVTHAMEIYHDLRFNLQEKYQYIMVDEFQDTNMAQMRILNNLTNNELQGDMPNIMVVGDDDQAIYSFQGADISNILDFKKNYPKAVQITLTENYRSTSEILNHSRNVIVQGKDRLEKRFKELNKQLNANVKSNPISVNIFEAENIASERHWLVNKVDSQIKNGKKPSDITIITRQHKEIENLLPYFYKYNIAVNYEKYDNALDVEPIILIEKISNLLINISKGNHDDVNSGLMEILAHKMWQIKPIDLWKLSLKAYNGHTHLIDNMSDFPEFSSVHQWLIETALLINELSLEQILDVIVGNNNQEMNNGNTFTSPIYEYFFSKQRINDSPEEYLTYLSALSSIRSKLREYHPDQTPNLQSFIDFINLNRKIKNPISINRKTAQSENAINIMTAHKSKGLEFDTVYIFNATDNTWGEKARGLNRKIIYPENLTIAPAGDSDDERLRLFYVAMTRAKHNLIISYSISNDSNKETLRANFLTGEKWAINKINNSNDTKLQIESAEIDWYQPLINPISQNMTDLLKPTLENYKLSVTHLNNFLDVVNGGPNMFLMQNLLHFPQAKSASSAFGTAIHETLQNTHKYAIFSNQLQAVEDIVSNFETNLNNQHLTKKDFEKYLQKGSDTLRIFFDKKSQNFLAKGQTELNFSNQHSIIENAHITGKLDFVEINKTDKTIVVTDYKTGKSPYSWKTNDTYEKIKLHKYRQQLLFYKLLVENARDYHGFEVKKGYLQFVEPRSDGEITTLETDFTDQDIERFKALINAVWDHIINLNLPDVSKYDQSINGIMQFENDLLSNCI